MVAVGEGRAGGGLACQGEALGRGAACARSIAGWTGKATDGGAGSSARAASRTGPAGAVLQVAWVSQQPQGARCTVDPD